jgi:hypothetical protein
VVQFLPPEAAWEECVLVSTTDRGFSGRDSTTVSSNVSSFMSAVRKGWNSTASGGSGKDVSWFSTTNPGLDGQKWDGTAESWVCLIRIKSNSGFLYHAGWKGVHHMPNLMKER